MARTGRPRGHDPKADEIRHAIAYSTSDDAIKAIGDPDLNSLDGEDRTPIIHASLEGKLLLVEWLVANGANINHQDRNGWTALHFAAKQKHTDIVEFLLKSGAAVNIRDIHGNTPLWRAVFDARGGYEVVNLLLAQNADPSSKNNAGRTPLDFASQIEDTTLEKILNKANIM